MEIKKLIQKLQAKYDTLNPFELADYLNIAVIYEDLGKINGYYNKVLRQKQIHINHNLSYTDTIFTCAHELGHALLHPDVNSVFLASKTLLSVNKLEIQANLFAVELLIPDNFLIENQNYTVGQIARMLGYNEELIKLKLK